MHNLLTITIFLGLGAVMVLATMLAGGFLRPKFPSADKRLSYECGEEPIGNSWVQFDLRFYIVALVFLIFDVEIALFYPWASVFQQLKESKLTALVDMLFFFGVLFVGYIYLWRFGYLEWVRSSVTTSLRATAEDRKHVAVRLSEEAHKDPELAESRQ